MSVSITIIFIPFTHDRHVPGFLCVNLIKYVIILSDLNTKLGAFIYLCSQPSKGRVKEIRDSIFIFFLQRFYTHWMRLITIISFYVYSYNTEFYELLMKS